MKALQRHLQLGVVLFTIMASFGMLAPATQAEGDATPVSTQQDEGEGKASDDEPLETQATAEPTAIPGEQLQATDDPGTPPDDAEPILVKPLPPTVVQPMCTDNTTITPGSVSFTPVTGVISPVDESGLAPGTIIYAEALVEPGYAWDVPLTGGWTATTDTTANITIHINDIICDEPGQTPTPDPTLVSPLPPVIVDATCVDGVFTAEYISFPPTEGVLYPNETRLDPNTTYYFTTRLETGYAWNLPLPTGWNLDSDGHAVFRLETGPPPECTAVQLPVPVIVQPRCENGTLIPGSITIPQTTGLILPDVDEMELFPDLTVRIVARLEPFYEIALPLTDGWVVNDQNELEFSFVTDTVECERPGAVEPTVPPTEPPATDPQGPPSAPTAPATDTTISALPVTGAPSTPGRGMDSLLLLLGSLALCATAFEVRKRRT